MFPVAYLTHAPSNEPPRSVAPDSPIEIQFSEKSDSNLVRKLVSRESATEKIQSKAKTLSPEKVANIFGGGFRQKLVDGILNPDSNVALAPASPIESSDDLNPFPKDPATKIRSQGHGWSSAVQYGNAMGLQFTLETLNFFEALHARVNAQLIYPEDFSKQRITGRVRIEAELSHDGKLLRFTSTTADDRLLQTYCFAYLTQILSQPLPQRAWLDTERTFVAFDFEFHTRVRHNIPRTLPMAIEKNRLSFARESEIDPWLNEKLNEIFTHYIPPIIPIPGGFYIDLISAYAYVNNLLNDAPTERELREERLTKLHDLLRMTLRANNAEPQPSPTPLPNTI